MTQHPHTNENHYFACPKCKQINKINLLQDTRVLTKHVILSHIIGLLLITNLVIAYYNQNCTQHYMTKKSNLILSVLIINNVFYLTSNYVFYMKKSYLTQAITQLFTPVYIIIITMQTFNLLYNMIYYLIYKELPHALYFSKNSFPLFVNAILFEPCLLQSIYLLKAEKKQKQ